jgi:type IV pilus assembly protein PilV
MRLKSSGFMLIEVLVAMSLSAVALLALASVNATALRYTKMSQYRALATQLATDIGERMRANKGKRLAAGEGQMAAGFWSGDYDFSDTFSGQATLATLPAQLCNTAASVCSTGELALLDLVQWRLAARSVLPEGSVYVSRQADLAAADVWIAWRDPLVASSDEAPALAAECPAGLGVSESSIRCSYFRIQL